MWARRPTARCSGTAASTVSLGSRSLGRAARWAATSCPATCNWSRYDPFGYVGVAGANNFVSATPNGPIRSAFGSSPNTTVRSSNCRTVVPAGRPGPGWKAADAGRRREGGTAANGQHKVMGARLGWAGGGPSRCRWPSTTSENNLTTHRQVQGQRLGGSATSAACACLGGLAPFKQAGAKQTNDAGGAVMPLGQWRSRPRGSRSTWPARSARR
jgi:hypothetical protein